VALNAAPRIAALDTSTERLALALIEGERIVAAVEEQGGARASARLLPALGEMLAGAGWTMAQLSAIAFARGPGAFTGLRTSAAAAQGLALALNRPVLPLDSLMLVAEDARASGDVPSPTRSASFTVGVAMDARMNEIYAGVYAFDEDASCWRTVDAPRVLDVQAVNEAWSALTLDVVAGSALAVFGDKLAPPSLHALDSSRVPTVRLPSTAARAHALARLAWRAHEAGAAVDAAQALPWYVRDKVALTTREREAAARPAVTMG
jgi:tRNA threonylcarbamoyladenosine biosynthesis protein TsaB